MRRSVSMTEGGSASSGRSPEGGARPLRLAALATSPVDGGSYYAVTPRSLPRMTEEGGATCGGGGTLIPVYIQIP